MSLRDEDGQLSDRKGGGSVRDEVMQAAHLSALESQREVMSAGGAWLRKAWLV